MEEQQVKKRRYKKSIVEAPEDLRDYELEQWETINAFEEKAWSSMNRGLDTGFEGINKALGGLQTGFHIIGGDSNIGKTSFISQMAYNVAICNRDDVYVIDFSLDDPMLDKMSRVIAASQRVLINAVKSPNAHKKYPDMLKRRTKGIQLMREIVDCYKCYDMEHGTDFEQIKATVQRHIVDLKTAGEKRKVVVFIDNFHDITTDAPESKGSDRTNTITLLVSFLTWQQS